MGDGGGDARPGGVEAVLGPGILTRMLTIERPSPGSAEEFHHRDVPNVGDVLLWWFEPASPALVLGSTQSLDIVDTERCREMGIDVVKRRSGGGAVYVSARHTLWADVIVPAGHPRWQHDIGRASEWMGDVWQVALADRHLTVHRGAFVASDWSRTICFAGRGPGELFDSSGCKVVGISQRRTRDWVRFQCAVSLVWDPNAMVEVLRVDGLRSDRIVDAGATLGEDVDVVGIRTAFEVALKSAISI